MAVVGSKSRESLEFVPLALLECCPWNVSFLGRRPTEIQTAAIHSHTTAAESSLTGWEHSLIPISGTQMLVYKGSCWKALFYEVSLFVLSTTFPERLLCDELLPCSVPSCWLTMALLVLQRASTSRQAWSRRSFGLRWRRSLFPLGLGRQGRQESQTFGVASVPRVELNNVQVTLRESFLPASPRLIPHGSWPRPQACGGIFLWPPAHAWGLSSLPFRPHPLKKIFVRLSTWKVKWLWTCILWEVQDTALIRAQISLDFPIFKLGAAPPRSGRSLVVKIW